MTWVWGCRTATDSPTSRGLLPDHSDTERVPMAALNNTSNIDVGSYPEHALVREADGLTSDEKLLLFTITSHRNGVSFATVDTVRQWTGLSRNKYYKARKSLLAKGLISEQRSLGGATTYRLRKGPLRLLARQGIARRRQAKQQRAVLTTSAPPEGVLTLGTTHAHDGQGSRARGEDATRAHGEHPKVNDEPNNEDIKNEKPRRVRPPRRGRPADPLPNLGTDQQEQIRARIAQHREKWIE